MGKIGKSAVDFSIFSEKLCFVPSKGKKIKTKIRRKPERNLEKKNLRNDFLDIVEEMLKKIGISGGKGIPSESRFSGISESVKNSVLKAISFET